MYAVGRVSIAMSARKVVLKMVMSLDGFVTSPDGTHEWMFEWFGDDSGEWNRRALEEAGVMTARERSAFLAGQGAGDKFLRAGGICVELQKQ